VRTGWAAAGLILFTILATLLAAGAILLVGKQPRGEPIRLLPAPTPLPLVVQVGGAIVNPGVYSLPEGSRAIDAIQLAGGALPGANLQAVNQAAIVQDGEMIWVPWVQPSAPPPPSGGAATAAPPEETQPTVAAPAFPIQLNTAGLDELEALPGIGPVLAQRILDYRLANGPFATIDDIQSVDGIGPGIFEKIKDLITVGGPPPGSAP
jgi:competence protein ComEA